MKNPTLFLALATVSAAFATDETITDAKGRTVTFLDCPRCERRMRFAPDGSSATINLARIRDDRPDDATIAHRKRELTARAFAMMDKAEDTKKGGAQRPLMGWSSWNTFRVHINEALILETARAMATNGLKAAGYHYVNIDDGFFGGRDEQGKLKFNPKRFPNGLKGTVDGIHALGFKAGIYSEGGANTCGSYYDNDKLGVGSGLYGHDKEDFKLYFDELDFDFIKIDFCGGLRQGLDPEKRYTEISQGIHSTAKKGVRFNVCRWDYPGTWISSVADSWRTTCDIRANWGSLKNIINENLYLSAYSSLGHYNDMDMLEVGHYVGHMQNALIREDSGFTEEEELTHFGLWCMFSSPLLIGCDARTIPETTLKLVTNAYLLMMNQNDVGVQGQVVSRDKDACVIVKDADRRFGTARYLALYNGNDQDYTFRVKLSELNLGGTVEILDLVEPSDWGIAAETIVLTVPPHATRFFRLDATERLEQKLYEAETAFLSDYQEIRSPTERGRETAFVDRRPGAQDRAAVFLGQRASNDLVWKDVMLMKAGKVRLEFRYSSPNSRSFYVVVDNGEPIELKVGPTANCFASVATEINLAKGPHVVRLYNDKGWMPDIDYMRIVRP